MRFLHTSDLHLGKIYLGRSFHTVHENFLRWLVERARELEVDAVLVAGDMFDLSAPSSQTRELYNRFCAEMDAAEVQLVVLGGNHDSPTVLSETLSLLVRMSTLVIPVACSAIEEQVHVIRGRNGEPGMVLCGVPFLRQGDVVVSTPGQSIEEKRQAVINGIARHDEDIHACAVARRLSIDPSLPIVATGHLATVGTSTSEAMREIYVGHANAFPTNRLPPADYVALGHIHKPMMVGGHEHVRYCGSPLALSFDEHGQDKQVLLVELQNGQRRIDSLPVPCFQPMARLAGTLEQFPARLAVLATAHTHEQPLWCEITLTEGGYVSDLMQQLEAMVEGQPVEIVSVVRGIRAGGAPTIPEQTQTLDEFEPAEVFEKRLEDPSIEDSHKAVMRKMFEQVLAEVLAEGEAGVSA